MCSLPIKNRDKPNFVHILVYMILIDFINILYVYGFGHDEHVQTCSNMFKHVQTCSNMFKHVQTCSNMFKHVQTINWDAIRDSCCAILLLIGLLPTPQVRLDGKLGQGVTLPISNPCGYDV